MSEVSPLQKDRTNKNFYLQSRIIFTTDQCQLCPGLHPQQPDQQFKSGGDSSCLLSPAEAPLVDQILGKVEQRTGRGRLAKREGGSRRDKFYCGYPGEDSLGHTKAKENEPEACAGQKEARRCWAKGEKGRLAYTPPQLSPWSLPLTSCCPEPGAESAPPPGWLQHNAETVLYFSTKGRFLDRSLPATLDQIILHEIKLDQIILHARSSLSL